MSRPGYGRTPLTEELKKSSAQADLIMALMDHLNVEKLPIMVASGAGVIGIRLALQYPDRIQALCMNCATSGSLTHKAIEMVAKGTGKSALCSPTLNYYIYKNIKTMYPIMAAGERMSVNNVKPGTTTKKEVDENLRKFAKDPQSDGGK